MEGSIVKNRNIFLFILLNTVTCGIYGIVALCKMSKEINEVCEGDGRDTMNYIFAFLLGIVTFGIFTLIWFYKAMERLKDNGYRYGITVKHSGSEYLLWTLLGSFIAVGPLVALCFFVSNVNQFSEVAGFVEPLRYSSNPVERTEIINAGFNSNNSSSVKALPKADNDETTYAFTNGEVLCITGEYQNCSFQINEGEELIIGKDPSVANIVIDAKRYPTVSRKHVGIKFDSNSQLYIVTDYSSNGTFVSGQGQRLERNSNTYLKKGTVINICEGENSFRLA